MIAEKLSDEEIELGADLIENMSDEFNPEKYRDEYRERVHYIWQFPLCPSLSLSPFPAGYAEKENQKQS